LRIRKTAADRPLRHAAQMAHTQHAFATARTTFTARDFSGLPNLAALTRQATPPPPLEWREV